MKTWPNDYAYKGDKELFQIISIIFRNNPAFLELMFDPMKPQINFSPEKLIDITQDYSSGHHLLFKIALDFWSSSGHATVAEVIGILDFSNFQNFLIALALRRKIYIREIEFKSYLLGPNIKKD